MNSAEKVYQTLQTFPQPLIEEVLQFVEFLQFKQEQLAHLPNETTIKAIQAAEKGEYEAVSLNDLKKQWSDA
ncbi:MAG: DUF2281 domain-containing protein [Methylococcaceae bacterium]